jgi:glucosamine-6-phosphate deaminase
MTPHAQQQLEEKIKLGQQKIVGKTILHTAPHHDDILLGYFPYALRNLVGNTNHVLYITSGANGVSDIYLAQHLNMSLQKLNLLDAATKQELKYRIREIESEKKWARVAGDRVQIKNLRAGFYDLQVDEVCAVASGQATRKGVVSLAKDENLHEIMQQDVQRVVDYLDEIQPDIITVLVDSVGIGPATHHRSQQVIMQAVARYNRSKPIEIIGYRNVWSSFSLEETSMIIPVTQDELDLVESIFQDCFVSQSSTMIFCEKNLELQNFAEQVTEIQKSQYQQVVQLLTQQDENKIIQNNGQSLTELKAKTGMIYLQNSYVKTI